MANENSSLVELLKYPVTVFSILLALIIGKYALGISFGAVSEVGPTGVKFDQDAKAEFVELEGKVNGALATLEEMKTQTAFKEAHTPEVQTKIFAASQSVSDQTAQLARLISQEPAGGAKPRGFIWLGDYREGWGKVTLAALENGRPITTAPDALVAGTEYTALSNLVVRDGLPSNDADYFRSRKNLGIIPRGSRVRLLKPPTPIDRKFAVQYWAEVELP